MLMTSPDVLKRRSEACQRTSKTDPLRNREN